ncbi:MAG: DUF5677 domain-containing protein [Flavobacterium sp.]
MTPNLPLAINELMKLNSIDHSIKDLYKILEGYVEIIQSIYDDMPKLLEGEVFIETISFKIVSTTHSILKLLEGYYVSTPSKQGTKILIDFSSINILTRVIIEAFLTLDYLFYNSLDDEERNFRFNIWRISGYKSRQNFFNKKLELKKDISEKLSHELEEIMSILSKVKDTKYYNELNRQELWKLDKFGLPRLSSWQTLLENSILKTSHFEVSYKLYSNYAHSEFISLIQMNGSEVLNKNSDDNNLAIQNALRTVKMICCVSIVLLKEKFECTLNAYENLDKNLKEMIEFWADFAIED